MTFHYDIHPEQRTIHLRYTGVFTLQDLTAAATLLWSDPRYSQAFDGIVDLTDGSLRVAQSDLRALIAFVLDHKCTSKGRWAAVTSSPFGVACALLYKHALSRRHMFEVFSTWEAACAFLEVKLAPGIPQSGALS